MIVIDLSLTSLPEHADFCASNQRGMMYTDDNDSGESYLVIQAARDTTECDFIASTGQDL